MSQARADQRREKKKREEERKEEREKARTDRLDKIIKKLLMSHSIYLLDKDSGGITNHSKESLRHNSTKAPEE